MPRRCKSCANTPLSAPWAFTGPLSITLMTPPGMGKRVMDAGIVRTVLHMMESDALPGGSGIRAAVPGYRLAIKTGTAEKMGPSGKYNGGYINYTADVAPASNPQVALVIVVNHPTAGDHFGGSVTSPIFGQAMGAVLRHMNIAPDTMPEKPPADNQMPAAGKAMFMNGERSGSGA